jgi:acetyl esterase
VTQTTAWKKWRRRSGKALMEGMFHGLSHIGKWHPGSRLHRHGLELVKDIPYKDTGLKELQLDVYRPIKRDEPLPVLVYVHGGAFQILSKETHWIMGLSFARKGYIVFNINYRLAPQHRYPKGLQDVVDACLWIKQHAHEYGGDASRMSIAGESAGANLSTSVVLASCYEHTEPWARPLWDAHIQWEAALPLCGILQVTDVERFIRRKKKISKFVADRILNIPRAYLPKEGTPDQWKLADPLVFLEEAAPPDRPMPPFYTAVGTKDPILDDTRRLKAALDRLEIPCEIEYYPKELHAFHAFVWRKRARACWKSMYNFLATHAPTPYTPNEM